MDQTEVSEEHIVPFDGIAEGVLGLRIAFVNVFGLRDANGGWTLVDAGVPLSSGRIEKWAQEHFALPPKAIVLTHGHFDHVSSAQALADRWDVPIFAHTLEFPYLQGQESYPPPNAGAGGGLMSLLSPMYPREPIDLGRRLKAFPSYATLPDLPDWEILHTPGHTPGHVSFFRPRDKALLPGDAFCTTKPDSFFEAALVQNPEMHGPPAYFTSDWEAAKASVRLLARLRPAVVAPGHGKPLAGPGVADALDQLAMDFEKLAVPQNVSKTMTGR